MDQTIPEIPEKYNPIFYVYPICMGISTLCMILWMCTKVTVWKSKIIFAGCFLAAGMFLLTEVIVMEHVLEYLDLSTIDDDQLLVHPIFVHNYTLSLMSIFGMSLYFLHAWIVVDHWNQMKKDAKEGKESSKTKRYTTPKIRGIMQLHELPKLTFTKDSQYKEEPGKLDPIPTLEKFPSETALSDEKTSLCNSEGMRRVNTFTAMAVK